MLRFVFLLMGLLSVQAYACPNLEMAGPAPKTLPSQNAYVSVRVDEVTGQPTQGCAIEGSDLENLAGSLVGNLPEAPTAVFSSATASDTDFIFFDGHDKPYSRTWGRYPTTLRYSYAGAVARWWLAFQ